MMKILNKTLIIFLLSVLFANEALALNFNPGNYEVTTWIEMPAMPEKGRAMEESHSECMTGKDLKMEVFTKDGCNLVSDNSGGNTISLEFNNCHFNDIVGISANITYYGDSFSGTMLYHSYNGGTARIVIKGKRLGNCDTE